MHGNEFINMCVCIHENMFACMHIYVYVFACIYMYTHIHAYVYIYKHRARQRELKEADAQT